MQRGKLTAMSTREHGLIVLLRIFGCTSLAAVYGVLQPTAWMEATHEWIGLGPFPQGPIAPYLARSLSAFYALIGGLLLIFSTDLERYRSPIRYVGVGMTLFGIALFFIDRSAGLPPEWALWEGPFVTALGLVMIWLVGAVPRRSAPG